MSKTLIAPAALLLVPLLVPACASAPRSLPDHRVPHQITASAQVEIAVRVYGDTWERQTVELPAGWWIASPYVVETH